VAVVWLGIAPGDARGARVQRLRCGTGVTLEQNAHVRILRPAHAVSTWGIYSCVLRTRRVFKLGQVDADTPEGVDHFELRGDRVAFQRYVCDHGGDCQFSVVVVDVRTRRTLFASATTEGSVTAIALSPSGAVAWMHSSLLGPTAAVSVEGPNGEQLLDEGTDLDRASLASAGARLYWIRAGVPRTAEF
jgi:hypothetical protein